MNNHEIKTIVAELQSMSPRTQLEIVRLCKRVAELTPDYIETLSREDLATFSALLETAKTELQSQITANANDIDTLEDNIELNATAINNEKSERESIVGVNTAGNTYLKTAAANKQILINNNGYIGLTSNNNNVDIVAPSGFVRISTDNASVRADEVNGVTLSTNESEENPNIVILRHNGNFEVSNEHTLKFDNSGALTIDGAEVGGANLYQHNIIFTYPISINQVSYQAIFRLLIINENSNNLTKEEIGAWILNNGYSGGNEVHIDGELNINGIRHTCYIGTLNGTIFQLTHYNGTGTDISYKNASDMTIRLNTTTAI